MLMRINRLVISAVLGLALTPAPVHADPRSELAQARHELAISEQVLARMAERADAARSDPSMGPEQRKSLDDYVARVRELVASNRERVKHLALAARTQPDGTGTPPPRAATHAEEVAALETRLGGSLSEFDQLLLEEARRAKPRGAVSGSGLPGGSGGGGTSAGASKGGATRPSQAPGAAGSEGAGGRPQQPADEPGSPGGRTESADPGASGAPVAPPPADVGDGADDDVVARQIRKVAESERDPQLREKLWDEYRKYKQGRKG